MYRWKTRKIWANLGLDIDLGKVVLSRSALEILCFNIPGSEGIPSESPKPFQKLYMFELKLTDVLADKLYTNFYTLNVLILGKNEIL